MFVYYVKDEKYQKLFYVLNFVLHKYKIITVDLLFQEIKVEGMRELIDELKTLVSKNFLAFNPTTAEYALQGRSMEIGLEMFAKMQQK